MVEHERLKALCGRVEVLDCLGKSSELPPEVVSIHVAVPVPALPRPRCPCEKWGEQNIVQDDARLVFRVQLEGAGVARFDGSAFREDDGLAGLECLKLSDGVRR